MKLLLAAVGRAKGPVAELATDYAGRIRAWPLTLKAIDIKGDPATVQMRESESLLKLIPQGARLVVCDERGKNLSSQTFAAQLGKWQEAGAKDVAFLLGGADGHTEALRARADFLLSFGTLTWPHMLARVMLLEQIYRAQQILAGHPYHRE
jgi:23S rRNA (pseudouridine1915-N3)-methyltransferase